MPKLHAERRGIEGFKSSTGTNLTLSLPLALGEGAAPDVDPLEVLDPSMDPDLSRSLHHISALSEPAGLTTLRAFLHVGLHPKRMASTIIAHR